MNQQDAFNMLKLGYNIFLTGSPGSGKTFLLNDYINFLKSKSVEVGITASTGIAATHINGLTIHSWTGIGIKEKLTENDLQKLQKTSRLCRRFEKTRVLIIDEVSMLQPTFLDLVDSVCKMFKQCLRPFGGMQIILCGDLFQLPPVMKNNKNINFINTSESWKNMDLKVCYIHEQHRHKDDDLTKILNDIRANNIGEHTLIPLRKRYKAIISQFMTPTKLYTHNIDVDSINNNELKKLPGKTTSYFMASRGNHKLVENLKKNCLAPVELKLKINALVMFVKNNYDKGYVNGTMGKVIDFDETRLPVVETLTGEEIVVEPEKWQYEENGKVRAEIRQIPLRLAWAITVHKSQGMTLDAAEIDLSRAFVEGMGYVALSRIKSLAGLRLMGLNSKALEVNEKILELDTWLKEESEKNKNELQLKSALEMKEMQNNFLRSIAPNYIEKPLSTYEKTKELAEQKLSMEEIAKAREMTVGTIISHLEKLLKRKEFPDIDYLRSHLPSDRFEKIKTAFQKSGDIRLSPVREILGEDFSYEEIRLARLFIIKDGEIGS